MDAQIALSKLPLFQGNGCHAVGIAIPAARGGWCRNRVIVGGLSGGILEKAVVFVRRQPLDAFQYRGIHGGTRQPSACKD
ncbi:hypothetical protein D3C71_1848790 [compost metagenome]